MKIKLFKDNSRYKEDLFVSVNGVNYKIRRGVEVEVPPEVAEVLEHSQQQDERSRQLRRCGLQRPLCIQGLNRRHGSVLSTIAFNHTGRYCSGDALRCVVGLHAHWLYAPRMTIPTLPGADRIDLMASFIRIVQSGSL